MAGDITYYGILQAVVELRYAEGMAVVLFMCKWYNIDLDVPGSTKYDRWLLSVNTNTSWYDNFPFILAKTVSQVFY
ncbi:DUF4216 domain-containing protein, partial [Pseudomonas syringae]|uniref:DUF4216 domain-containing protein n=1 Tax=Pseudomonas syringae TaxID=317 RepID=UPI0034D95376